MKKNLCLTGLLIGGGLALGITAAGLFVISMWVGFSQATAYYLVKLIFFLAVTSMLAGGFGAGYYSASKGWLHGTIVGVVYAAFLLILPRVLVPQVFPWGEIIKEAFFYTSLAAFAGIAGVNYQGYRMRRKNFKRMY